MVPFSYLWETLSYVYRYEWDTPAVFSCGILSVPTLRSAEGDNPLMRVNASGAPIAPTLEKRIREALAGR